VILSREAETKGFRIEMSLRRAALAVGFGDVEVGASGFFDVDLVASFSTAAWICSALQEVPALIMRLTWATTSTTSPLNVRASCWTPSSTSASLASRNEVVAKAAVELALRVGPLDDLGERAGGVALLAPRLEAVEHDVADVDDAVGLPDRVERTAELEDLAIVVPLGAPLRTPGLDGPGRITLVGVTLQDVVGGLDGLVDGVLDGGDVRPMISWNCSRSARSGT